MRKILPYKTIGIIGGGQLGKMMALEAKAMGYYVAVLEPTPNGPCAQVCDMEINAEYSNMEAIKKLASVSHVITYEFEKTDYEALKYLQEHSYLPQGSDVLKTTKHRFLEKTAIKNMGIPVADFQLIESPEHLKEIAFYPSVVKTTTDGYDGKGQVVLKSSDDLGKGLKLVESAECIIEKWMSFSKEVSVIVARSTTGEVSTFPVAENIHVNNCLHLSIAPARISPELAEKATACAKKIAEELGSVGVLGVEMFVVDDEIYVNELAPRPHNSGHYTQNACVTNQFEQHVRAVCGLPLGDPTQHTPCVMVNILIHHMDMENIHNLDRFLPLLKNGHIHLYGKAEAKEGRKMGHINLLGDIEESLETINRSGIWRE